MFFFLISPKHPGSVTSLWYATFSPLTPISPIQTRIILQLDKPCPVLFDVVGHICQTNLLNHHHLSKSTVVRFARKKIAVIIFPWMLAAGWQVNWIGPQEPTTVRHAGLQFLCRLVEPDFRHPHLKLDVDASGQKHLQRSESGLEHTTGRVAAGTCLESIALAHFLWTLSSATPLRRRKMPNRWNWSSPTNHPSPVFGKCVHL